MQIKHILAAAALVATGASNAAIESGTNGDGSLFLIAFDNLGGTTTAGLFDLGYSLTSFAGAGNASATSTLGALAAPETTVVWDFVNNTIKLNGSLVTNLGTNNWTAAYNTLLANADAGEIQYVVGANDTTGTSTNKRSLISGSQTASAQDRLNQNTANNTALGQISNSFDIFTPIATKGTIGSADNGAYTFTAADGATTRDNGYVMADDGFSSNWRLSNKLGGTVDAGVTNGLWLVDGGTAGNERLLGRVTFSTANGTLTYTNATTPAIPEPSTYALALIGLAVAGVAALRRRA